MLFGLGFLLLVVTKFTKLVSDNPIPLTFTILMAVGCFASIRLARQAGDRAKTEP